MPFVIRISPEGVSVSQYKVALEVYNGPLDLLLFLIRRDEIDIYDIPISRITDSYLEYVRLLEQVDPDIVSEFLVLAATLVEIKSRTLLPHPPPEESDDEIIDPRLELVRQLLEYKKYKDAARNLEFSAAERAMRHARSPVLPELPRDEVALDNIDIWNLFDAFNRVLKQIGKGEGFHQVTVDDTPVSLHAADIVDSLERAGGTQIFEEIFIGRQRGELIGMFLALLELIRQRRVRATQDRSFGPIHIVLLDASPLDEVADAPPVEEAMAGFESDVAFGESGEDLIEENAKPDPEAAAWLDEQLESLGGNAPGDPEFTAPPNLEGMDDESEQENR